MVVRSPPVFLNAATSASSSSHTFSGDLQTYDLVRLLQLHFVSQSVEYVCKLIGNEYVLNILIYFREYLNKYIYNSVLPPPPPHIKFGCLNPKKSSHTLSHFIRLLFSSLYKPHKFAFTKSLN